MREGGKEGEQRTPKEDWKLLDEAAVQRCDTRMKRWPHVSREGGTRGIDEPQTQQQPATVWVARRKSRSRHNSRQQTAELVGRRAGWRVPGSWRLPQPGPPGGTAPQRCPAHHSDRSGEPRGGKAGRQTYQILRGRRGYRARCQDVANEREAWTARREACERGGRVRTSWGGVAGPLVPPESSQSQQRPRSAPQARTAATHCTSEK